jgi:spermidine synthase
LTEWFHESLYPSVRQSLRIDNVVYRGKTKFQDVLIFENEYLGRVLVLDDVVQTTEADEFFYHETLSHVPIVGHGAAKAVLIVGGGDGGMLEEVLKHPIDRAVLVDIDGEVVELCREHLSSICGAAFDDPRTELMIGDGIEFVQTTEQRFDVIIVDSTDPVGPGEVLFGKPFYEACRSILSQDGVIVTQNGVPFFQGPELTQTHRFFSALFKWSGFFLVPVPTYSGGHMAFGWASDSRDLSVTDVSTVQSRLDLLSLETRYYNADVHVGSFALPNCVRGLMS